MSAFRGFRDEDLPELERMALALHEEDPCDESMSPAKIRDTACELSARPEKGTIVIFEEEGAVAGYAFVVYRWSNEYGGDVALVDELYVKPAWRGKGIGASFLDHVLSMKDGAIRGIQLEVHPVNARALALYRARGFARSGNVWLFKKTGSTRPADDAPSAAGKDGAMTSVFPDAITRLPEADVPLEGVRTYLSQSDDHQIVFMEFSKDVSAPEHSHEAQWAVVLEGRIDLVIDGTLHTLGKGDHYYIPRGVKHSARIYAGYADVTYFDQKDRYRRKK